MSDHATRSSSSGGASTVTVSLAAIGSVLAASSCCLPLFPFLMMAVGLACRLDLPFASAAISPWWLDPVYRFRVLSRVAREEMPASNECHLIGPVVGLRSLCIRLDLFPAGHGEPHSRFGSEVIL